MTEYNCKKCKAHFYTSQGQAVIYCPMCLTKQLNLAYVTPENFLYLETMFKNIMTYGKKGTLELIDRLYNNAVTRARVRQCYFKTIKIMEG